MSIRKTSRLMLDNWYLWWEPHQIREYTTWQRAECLKFKLMLNHWGLGSW